MHKVLLSRRQRRIVRYARKYTVAESALGIKVDFRRRTKVPRADFLVEGFDPGASQWDARLLYDVAGVRLGDLASDDETSEDGWEPPPPDTLIEAAFDRGGSPVADASGLLNETQGYLGGNI